MLTMIKRYITIKEYAEYIGADVETATAEIKKDENRKYYSYINGEIVIDCEILGEIIFEDDKKIEITRPQTEEQKDTSFLLEHIKRLEQTIETKDERIEELTNKIFDITERAQAIAERALNTTNQAQTLHAVDKGIVIQEEQRIEEVIQEEEEKKRGFFARLFGKK